MPAIDTRPKLLRPYLALGLDLSWNDGSDEAPAQVCPWCGNDEGKFSVNLTTGLWQCFRCRESTSKAGKGGGSVQTFLAMLWERSESEATEEDYEELALDRTLLDVETLKVWGVRKSFLTGEWIAPGYSPTGKITQIYRYESYGGAKRILRGTPECGSGLFGVPLFDAKKTGDIYFHESLWNALAWWETLRSAKRSDELHEPLEVTGNEEVSLSASCNVLAAPGARTFLPSWQPLFAGKRVVLVYDSDHPKPNKAAPGKTLKPAGWEGAELTAKQLAAGERKPESIHVLAWGPDGYDPEQPSGWDVRDYLSKEQIA